MDTLFLVIFFASIFAFVMLFSAGIHWVFNRYFGIRLYPKGFFNTDRDTWSKW